MAHVCGSRYAPCRATVEGYAQEPSPARIPVGRQTRGVAPRTGAWVETQNVPYAGIRGSSRPSHRGVG